MEETRQDALEVAQEADASPKETAEDAAAIAMGAWGSPGSWRAPVNGNELNGFAES